MNIIIIFVFGACSLFDATGRGFTEYSLARVGEAAHARREAEPHAHSWMDSNVSATAVEGCEFSIFILTLSLKESSSWIQLDLPG